jgi:regulatory protein
VARLHDLGYLDEAAFARALVARRARSRGPALIAAELSAKGIARELVRDTVGEVSREDLLAAAGRVAAKDAGRDRRIVAGRLQRRGFPADVIREALSRGS